MAEYYGNSLKDRIKWLYLQWELHTPIYMLEPWEKRIFNTVALSLLAICCYMGTVLVPRIYSLVSGN